MVLVLVPLPKPCTSNKRYSSVENRESISYSGQEKVAVEGTTDALQELQAAENHQFWIRTSEGTPEKRLLRNSFNPAPLVLTTVSFNVTTRFNPIQQSIAMYNSHIFNVRNTTIKVTKRSTTNDQRSTKTFQVYSGFSTYYPCVRQYFYINHMHSKCSHCNVSKLSVYYKIARSFTLFSLRKCMQLHHFIS